MKRTLIAYCIVAVCLIFGTGSCATNPDFSGIWVLDKVKSENLPSGVDQRMIVTQSGDKISLDTKSITDRGEVDTSDLYDLTGKEVEFTTIISEFAAKKVGKGNRTVKRTADGVEVNESLAYPSQNGDATVQAVRKWTLSSDGKILKIDITVLTPNGTQRTKHIFNKK